jgi:hypothetical protein
MKNERMGFVVSVIGSRCHTLNAICQVSSKMSKTVKSMGQFKSYICEIPERVRRYTRYINAACYHSRVLCCKQVVWCITDEDFVRKSLIVVLFP